MERSLISYIWRYSRRDQFVLVIVTLALFPLLYLTLELPKRIINDAIGAQGGVVRFYGISITQMTLLVGLCLAFLASVIAHGLLKMRVNTMKGTLAERLLRRFRYTLTSRILRFPRSYRISEGELSAMVTAEAEPLGGIMGDAFAQPLLQAGQMATILLFLFVQNVWFGLAAVALIPVQAWLIPRMQARINILNRSRIRQVRSLASEIGELSEGAPVLRQHGGTRYRRAAMSARLGGLFSTRLEIYRRKYFMKFTNNFLTQLTPFFYFLIGGILVINGQLTIGALVAALSAFKDLSSPWKELLTYYTAIQEVSQRYAMIVERFAPVGLLDADTEGGKVVPAGTPRVVLDQAVLEDEDGRQVLARVDLELAPGSWTCIAIPEEEDCTAVAQMLQREVPLASGKVMWGDISLADIAAAQVAARVAHVTSVPHIFEGTLGDNVMLPLRQAPDGVLDANDRAEALRSGNSTDRLGEWPPAPDVAQRADADWRALIARAGGQRMLLSRALDHRLAEDDPVRVPMLAAREAVTDRLLRTPLTDDIQHFAPDVYVDDLTLVENLLHALPSVAVWQLAIRFDALLKTTELRDATIVQGQAIAATLLEVFDGAAVQSVAFQRLGLPDGTLKALKPVMRRITSGSARKKRQKNADDLLLISLALNIPASQMEGVFLDTLRADVVAARGQADPALTAEYVSFDAAAWHVGLTAFENLIFGKILHASRPRREEIKALVVDVLNQQIDEATLSALIHKLPTARRGANLPPQVLEQVSLAQAIVKRADLVILDRALANHESTTRYSALAVLRELLPDATILQLETQMPAAGMEDRQLELRQGQIVPSGEDVSDTISPETSDLQRKVQALRKAPLFRELSRPQLRLLAFSARWVSIDAGTYVFRKNDLPDGAFLIFQGEVDLVERTQEGEELFVIHPPEGTLVGELGLIRNDPRRLDMRAQTDLTLLRIEAGDFLSILESDARTGFKLIKSLIGYLDRPR